MKQYWTLSKKAMKLMSLLSLLTLVLLTNACAKQKLITSECLWYKTVNLNKEEYTALDKTNPTATKNILKNELKYEIFCV
jgi:hypothetical protein